MHPVPRCVIALVLLAQTGAGCRRTEKDIDDTPTRPVPTADRLPPGEGAARDGMPTSWYRLGSFTYAEGQCFFDPPDPPPGTRVRLEFECGIIAIGLASEVRARNIDDLLSTVHADILRDHSGDEFGALVIRVPERTERAALLRILEDGRVRYASLNWMMGTQG